MISLSFNSHCTTSHLPSSLVDFIPSDHVKLRAHWWTLMIQKECPPQPCGKPVVAWPTVSLILPCPIQEHNQIFYLPTILLIHSAAGTAALWWPHFRSWNLFAISTAPDNWGPRDSPSAITHLVVTKFKLSFFLFFLGEISIMFGYMLILQYI